MAKSSTQPAHTPDIDVCPFLGRESTEPDGAPIPLSLPRDGGGDLRPSPLFRCLALPDGARIDAGRRRRLCLSARHTACRRYGDAEERGALPAEVAPTPISTADLVPAEDDADTRMGRIRRRYGSRGQDANAPRARVTVAGRPVDFTPRDDSPPKPTETSPLTTVDAEAEADRLGRLWDDHVELDRLGASQTGEPPQESDTGVSSPPNSGAGSDLGGGAAGGSLTDLAGTGFDMPAEDRPIPTGPAGVARIEAPRDGSPADESDPRGGDAWETADSDTVYSVNPPLGDDAWADPGADRDDGFDRAREAGLRDDIDTDFGNDFDNGFDSGFDSDAPHDTAGDAAYDREREFIREDAADWEREAASQPEPPPSAPASRPQPALAAAVSGALGGLGAAGGGDRRGRLMGIAGVLLIVVGIVSAVLAVVVGFNKSGDPTAPIVAAEADTVAGTTAESASVAAAPTAEAPTTEAATAEGGAIDRASSDTGAAPTRTGSVPPADTPEATAGGPAPERTGSVPAVNDSDASATPDAASADGAGTAPTEADPATDVDTPATPDSALETDPAPESLDEPVVPVLEPGPDAASVDAAVPDFVVPDGPAPDYGWVSYWPETEVHAIAQGDTISSLAAQFDTHAYAITCLNTQFWSDSQRTFSLIVGTSLVIPVGYTIPGDDQTLFQYLQTGFLLRRCG